MRERTGLSGPAYIFMQVQTSQQCVVVSFDTYCMNARGKINIYDIPILSFNISLDNPNLANLVSRHILIIWVILTYDQVIIVRIAK